MGHPLVDQLRFTRSEWLRGLDGVSEEDAKRHFGPMNSIGWIVGHLTWQEQRYLLHRPQGIMLRQDIQDEFASGAPMSTPSFAEMLAAWRTITAAADPFLDSLTTDKLLVDLPLNGQTSGQTQGSAIRRLDRNTVPRSRAGRRRRIGGTAPARPPRRLYRNSARQEQHDWRRPGRALQHSVRRDSADPWPEGSARVRRQHRARGAVPAGVI